MAIPIASVYAPINDLNASIQAQDARGMADRLARQQLNNQMIADAINAQVRQKQIASESGDRQQHYSLQRQQLANDMAYRNQALGMQNSQFDKQFGLNEAIARHQIANPRIDPNLAAAAFETNQANAASSGVAGGVNLAFKLAKDTRDAEFAEVKRIQESSGLRDIAEDWMTSDSAWATRKRAADKLYRETIAKITADAQGKVKIRNKTRNVIDPRTNTPVQVMIEDEFEADPIVMPSFQLPGAAPRVAPEVPTGPGVNPTPQDQPTTGINPFTFFGLTNAGLGGGTSVPQGAPMKRGSYSTFNGPQQAPQATPMAPMVQPAQLPRRFIYNANGTLSPAP